MVEHIYKIDETDELPSEGYYWFTGETYSSSYEEWNPASGPTVICVSHDYDDHWVEFAGDDQTYLEGEVRGIFVGPLDIPAALA